MGQLKSEIPKDWFLQVATESGRKRVNAAVEKREVKTVEDLPKLVTVNEASEILRTHPKTVSDWMIKKYLKSRKVRGRRFTSAEWINEFLMRELERNG